MKRLLALSIALTVSAPGLAEVGAYTDGEQSERPPVVIEIASITDDGTPQLWERHSPNEDGRIRVLNPAGAANVDGRPSVLIHPITRTPFAAWARASATGYDVVVSRFVSGEWSVPVVVAGGAEDEVDAHLIADRRDGTLHLFYGVLATTARIEHRSATADGLDWSTGDIVSAAGEAARRPAATFHAGRLMVTYESHVDPTARQIVVTEHNGEGWQSTTIADTFYVEANRPQIHSDGVRLWVDWIDQPDTMRWSRRDASEAWSSLAAEPYSGGEDLEYHVRGRVRRAVRQN